ncbi:hypothetical protein ACFJIX_11085 [Roseateles sp. UC29_93]|uniref:hypothetical protein n=1 Tax=Roseateles sp. UC29_93 TaxID=3350177 RepID=UPI0036733206
MSTTSGNGPCPRRPEGRHDQVRLDGAADVVLDRHRHTDDGLADVGGQSRRRGLRRLADGRVLRVRAGGDEAQRDHEAENHPVCGAWA